MSVIVTLRVTGDPAVFEEQASVQADTIGRIMDVAKSHGLIAHRWYGGDGEFMVIDEWPAGTPPGARGRQGVPRGPRVSRRRSARGARR